MKKQLSVLVLVAVAAGFTGCGSQEQASGPAAVLPPVGTIGGDGAVVKARSLITVSTGGASQSRLLSLIISQALAASNGSVPVSTTVSPSVTFSLDTSLFSVPSSPTAFAIDDFGFLQVGALKDNNLDVCGTGGNQHCGTALIRLYTTGTAGAGLWNAVDQYGAPITAGLSAGSMSTVGLNVAGAAIMQQVTMAANKHTIQLNDFTTPKYDVKVDFTNAGAGAYATTLVLEYAVSP